MTQKYIEHPDRKWKCGSCGEYTWYACSLGDACPYMPGAYPYRCHNPNCKKQPAEPGDCYSISHWHDSAVGTDYIDDGPNKRVVETLAWDDEKGWVTSA